MARGAIALGILLGLIGLATSSPLWAGPALLLIMLGLGGL